MVHNATMLEYHDTEISHDPSSQHYETITVSLSYIRSYRLIVTPSQLFHKITQIIKFDNPLFLLYNFLFTDREKINKE